MCKKHLSISYDGDYAGGGVKVNYYFSKIFSHLEYFCFSDKALPFHRPEIRRGCSFFSLVKGRYPLRDEPHAFGAPRVDAFADEFRKDMVVFGICEKLWQAVA